MKCGCFIAAGIEGPHEWEWNALLGPANNHIQFYVEWEWPKVYVNATLTVRILTFSVDSKSDREFYPRTWFSFPCNLFLANLSKRCCHSPSYSSQQPGYPESPLSWVPPLPNPSLGHIKHTSTFYLQSFWLLHSSLPPTSPYLDYCPLVAPSFHCVPFDHSPQCPADHITLLIKSSHLFPLNWE